MTNSAHETSYKFLTSATNYAELYKLGEKNSVVYTVDLDDSGAFEEKMASPKCSLLTQI